MDTTVLLLEWKSFGTEFVVQQLKKRGYNVYCYPIDQANEDMRKGEKIAEKLTHTILETRPVFVFSFNYFPVAAIACQACKTKYALSMLMEMGLKRKAGFWQTILLQEK